MYISKMTIENFRGIGEKTTYNFNKGVTVLVGENDCGKTTIIDAIRYVLGTTDQSWNKIELSDYHNENTDNEIRISLCFSDLSLEERASFMECLTYLDNDDVKLYINWTAKYLKNVKPNRTMINLTCGKNCDVTAPSPEAKELLRVTYLRPLRDAYSQMKSGRNSRLAQIMSSIEDLNTGITKYVEGTNLEELSLSGIFDLSNYLLGNHKEVKKINSSINEILEKQLLLNGDSLNTEIVVSGVSNTTEQKIYSLLEKLDLRLCNAYKNNYGYTGLGTSNLLSMACEMLLNKDTNSSFMLIEEPEAHIHAQRQLKMMQSLIENSKDNQQIIMSTHSLTLTSVIKLENLIYIQNHKPYPMGKAYTKLDESDYVYLERYLDATKANLFFSKGVLIVEGPGEELLLPSIAKLIGKDLTNCGISIVNVRSRGLMRYARIFQRENTEDLLKIPVACITDRDVLPNCAPAICLKNEYSDSKQWPENRKWKVENDIEDKDKWMKDISCKMEGQHVNAFIAEQWTLEYELAKCGLANDMLRVISKMVGKDINEYTQKYDSFKSDEEKASYVYSFFSKKIVSKAEFSQYFSLFLEKEYFRDIGIKNEKRFPPYLVDAIKYVTTPIDD